MVMRYHQEKLGDEKKAEKEESAKLRRIAGQIAKQIKDFWNNVEKVCELVLIIIVCQWLVMTMARVPGLIF